MYHQSIEVLLDNRCYKEAAAKAKVFESSGISLSDDLSSHEIAKKYAKRYWYPEQKSKEETMMFYGLLEYITDKKFKNLCCKHVRRFAYPLEAHFESCEYSKFYRLAIAQGPNLISSMDDSLSTSLTYYDVALHLSTICEHFKMHEALVINLARSYSNSNGSFNPKILTELENLSRSSKNVGIKLNAHLLLAKHDKSKIPKAMEVCHNYHCLPMEIELSIMELQSDACRQNQSFIQLAQRVQYLHSIDETELLNRYEEMLGVHKGKTDEGYYLEQPYFCKYFEEKFICDCYLIPHASQDIWIQMLSKNTHTDPDGMHIVSSNQLFDKIKEYLKGDVLKTMINFSSIESLLQYEFHSKNRFNPEEIGYSLQCCQLMLLEYDSHNSHACYYEAATLLRQYHSIEWSCYFPLCTNFVAWIDSKNKGFLYFQSHIKMWIKNSIARQQHFDFLKFWEQASIAKLIQTLQELHVSSTSQPSDYVGALKCYKMAMTWIDVCNQAINNPLKSCTMYFETCLPEFIQLDYNFRSIIDSINVYGTIVLALLSCVSDLSAPIIIPHMYYRALQVYDSLLPKTQEQNILDSCSYQFDHLIKCGPAGKQKLLQCLYSALDQIELVTKEKPNSLCQHSDLPRLTIILILTLYMNYAVASPDSSDLHLRCEDCLRKLAERETLHHNLSLSAVCNAFQEATHPFSLLGILKYLLCPNMEKERYESLAMINFSKEDKKIIIESVDDEDIRIPAAFQTQTLLDVHNLSVSPLVPKGKRQQYLYFSLPCEYQYPLRTIPSEPIWMHYKECGEEVHDHVREFIHQVISKDPTFSSTIRDKMLFQQYLHCLTHKVHQE